MIEVTGELDSVTRIGQVPIKITATGQLIQLADIATISRTPRTPASEIALIERQQGIMIAARMLNTHRVDLWLATVREAVTQFEQTLPANIKVNWLFEQESYTNLRLNELIQSLLLGFAIIVTVLMLTLGLRNALIVALSLPLTALFTLACMKFTGLPIHQMSVTGLVVALGIMVDNAIVIVDAIAQKRREGQSAIAAVKATLSHLWLPLAGSTITTMLAFAPIVLMPGAAGEFVGGIAISVMFALLGSYLISHTIIAGFAGRFGQNEQQHWYQSGLALQPVANAFKASLSFALKKPIFSAIVIGVIPLIGFYASTKMTEQFFPPSDRDMFQIEVFLTPNASIDYSHKQILIIDEFIRQQTGIEQLDWIVGGNVPSFYYNLMQRQRGAQNYAQAMVKATDFNTANQLIPKLQQLLDERFAKAQIMVRKLEQGPPFNAPIELRIFGPNLDNLTAIADQARLILSQHVDVLHTRSTLTPGSAKVWLEVEQHDSSLAGISHTEIANQVQMATVGVIGGSVIETTELLPIRVRLDKSQRQQQQQLAQINLITQLGHQLPIGAIADISIKVSRAVIPRRNGERINTVEAILTSGVLPAKVLTDIMPAINQIQLPAGYRIEVGGESAKRNEAVGNLLSNIVLVLTLLLTTLVLSFNSFRLTAIILLSALQSAGLGLLAVYSFGYPFGFTVIIGLLGLMGLAINAAIVILAELELDPKCRQGDLSAIISAVSSCGRHIGSTTITTVGGFLPLIIAGGGFWPPFAIAIAGGTLLTTLLSLIWVPVMYSIWMRTSTDKQTQLA